MYSNALSNSLLSMCETHFFYWNLYYLFLVENDVRKKNLAQTQRNKEIYVLLSAAQKFEKKIRNSPRLRDMIREHKSMTSTWLWNLDFLEKVWSYQINRKLYKECKCVFEFEFYMRHVIEFHVKIGKLFAFYFKFTSIFDNKNAIHTAFAFNNIEHGTEPSEYVFGIHSQSHIFSLSVCK